MNEGADQRRTKRQAQSDAVRDIEFAGSTYQVEVYDAKHRERRWPVFQFDEEGEMRDAFCSCISDEAMCTHMAAAHQAILGPSGTPLHIRFERSLWKKLFWLLGEHAGFQDQGIEKIGAGKYAYQNDAYFGIHACTPAAKQSIEKLIEKRQTVTPETSIKFSNLAPEEIVYWREGRASSSLRYALSIWSDLAKWFLQQEDGISLIFTEDKEGYPTHLAWKSSLVSASCVLQKEDIPALLPYLPTVESNLRLFQSSEERVTKITFDAKKYTFQIAHSSLSGTLSHPEMKPVGKWDYVSGVGFFEREGDSLLNRSEILQKDVPLFLDQFHQQIAGYMPLQAQKRTLSYEMYFDPQQHWHFTAYLLQPGDLSQPGAALLGNWAYIPEKGFYALHRPLFPEVQSIVRAADVSHFINQHRIWLNSQAGFQTHLASLETHLTYEITEKRGLHFYTKMHADAAQMVDCGEWIYYPGQGFFTKTHTRLESLIRPGLIIHAKEVSSFIKKHRDELRQIPRFFIETGDVLMQRELLIAPESRHLLRISPQHKTHPSYADKDLLFYGDFVYVRGEGFWEMPLSMRFPERYQQPREIAPEELGTFVEEDLPTLMRFLAPAHQQLLSPCRSTHVEVDYLVRTAGGRLKGQFFFRTPQGRIPLTDLLEAVAAKDPYYLNPAGLLHIQEDIYQWLRRFHFTPTDVPNTVEFSMLDLLSFDAFYDIEPTDATTPTGQITRQLLQEMREFTTHDTPHTKGLKSELRLYQKTGLHWLWFLYKNGLSGLLCDDMGLGKTHQAMALIAAAHQQKTETKQIRYLVVCPTSVIYHWEDKLATYLPHIPVHTFHGVNRSLAQVPNEALILTSYGILRLDQEALSALPFQVAIFDEVQVAKNRQSRVHAALRGIQGQMRIGLSGTPIENNLWELKALFDIILPGYMPSEARFREVFINPIEKEASEEKKILLSHLIRPFILRRRKAEVLEELPEKSEDKSYCELSEEQASLYQGVLEQRRESLVAALRDQTAPVNYIHVFSLLSQLKQVCNHPALFHKDPQNYANYRSGKWDLFTELLREARQSEQKVVVFSQYLHMLDIMTLYLQEQGWQFAEIRGNTINRQAALKRFQEDPACLVFIGSLQAAGLGIDLTAASVVIMYDRWWNAARENQAIDRVHRIGQKRGVQVYKLIAKNTIEEKIDAMIIRKGKLLEEVIKADDQSVLKQFSRSELIELLTAYKQEG